MGKAGFSSLEESDKVLVERWNNTCDENSVVFHLGDLIFNDGKGDRFYQLLDNLQFKELFLLLGNHTSGHRQAYLKEVWDQFGTTDYEVYPLSFIHKGRKVTFLPQYVELYINSTELVLCHYPIASWNNMGKNSIHLSGHCHSNYPGSNKDTGIGRQLDVGVESFGAPVSLSFIKNYLKDRGIKAPDHHGP